MLPCISSCQGIGWFDGIKCFCIPVRKKQVMQSAWKIQDNGIKFIGYFSFKPGSVEYGCS